jgi:hypothetical protein
MVGYVSADPMSICVQCKYRVGYVSADPTSVCRMEVHCSVAITALSQRSRRHIDSTAKEKGTANIYLMNVGGVVGHGAPTRD